MQVKNILIVDDDPDDCEFFTTVVVQIDPEINVTAASSKEELFFHLEQNTPDLLFVDAFIQLESGLASIQDIRKENRFKQLPVIMYTGSADLRNVTNAFQTGASAYIVKPHTLREVKTVLQIALHQDWLKQTRKQYYLDGEFQDYKE